MSSFINNTLKLVSGSVVAQVLGVLLIPIITRLYSPDDFGIYQLILSITGVLAIISCFAYQLSIMLPEKDEDAANIVALCIGLITVTSFVSGLVLIIFAKDITILLNAPEIADYLPFVPVIVFLNGLFFVLNYWLSRRVKFGSIAKSRVVNSVGGKGVQIGFSAYVPSALGLISGMLIGYIFGNLMMIKNTLPDKNIFKNISWYDIKKNAIRYKKFPLFSSWSTGANALSLQVAPFMLAFFFTTYVVGQFSIANQAINLPMSLIGGAIGQVFFQRASEEINKTGSIKNLVYEVYKRLISIGVFPMLLLMIIGEELFGFVFGADWTTAGFYVKILAPWLLLVFIASPLSTLFSVLERQGVGLFFNVSILLSRVIVLLIGGIYGDPVIALLLYSVTGILFWGGMNCLILKLSGVEYTAGILTFLKYLIIAFIISVPLILVKYMNLNSSILFLVAIGMTLIYYLYVVMNDQFLKKELFGLIGRN